MPKLHFSEDEYNILMERIYKVINRTEQLDQVTHHLMWEVWRLLHFSNIEKKHVSNE